MKADPEIHFNITGFIALIGRAVFNHTEYHLHSNYFLLDNLFISKHYTQDT